LGPDREQQRKKSFIRFPPAATGWNWAGVGCWWICCKGEREKKR